MDTLDRNSLGELLELRLGDLAVGAGAVSAHDARPRQLELPLELTVVGEEQKPFGHEVEAPDRHQPRQAGRQMIVDRRAALRVVRGRDRPLRLVETVKARGLCRADRAAVDGDSGNIIDQCRRRRELFAIERDAALDDHSFDLAPRGDSGPREQLRDSLRPILAGLSRKSVIGRVLGLPEQQRLEGTAAVVSLAIAGGADIVRVHDVAAMTRVARMADAVVRGAPAEGKSWTDGTAG